MSNLNITQYKPSDTAELKKATESFNQHLIDNAAIASNNIRSDDFDINSAVEQTEQALTALNVQSSLQAMLAAQMLSIHDLQQKTMACASACIDPELKKYYTNSAVKLSNCFVKQASVLAKLQGVAEQKIVVERVDVHQGGQAIVGNVHRGLGNKEKI